MSKEARKTEGLEDQAVELSEDSYIPVCLWVGVESSVSSVCGRALTTGAKKVGRDQIVWTVSKVVLVRGSSSCSCSEPSKPCRSSVSRHHIKPQDSRFPVRNAKEGAASTSWDPIDNLKSTQQCILHLQQGQSCQ